MATSTQLKAVLILLCLSFGNTAYSPWARWVLTSTNVDTNSKFKDLTNNNGPIEKEGGNSISAGISCSAFHTDGNSYYYGSSNQMSAATTEFGMSFWINLQITTTQYPILISASTPAAANYWLYIDEDDGTSTFYSLGNTKISTIVIPRDKWVFLVFYWTSGTPWTWTIMSPEFSTIASTSSANQYPGNYFILGYNTDMYYYEVQVFKKAAINGQIVTLYDSVDATYGATTSSCPNSCSNYCHPEMGCLSKATCQCPVLCTCSANDGVCSSCSDPNGVLANDCQCKDKYSLEGFTCVLALPLNCVDGTSKTVCTQCEAGYFLYDNGANTSCMSCATSCSSCTTTPDCFECASLIVQDGGSCREDSIGYQLSFSSTNIVIDFAHPLPKTVKISKLKASTEANIDIPDAGSWTINSSSSTSKQLIIQTTLTESSLPINIDFNFEQIA